MAKMNKFDAARILNISGALTKEKIKTAYRDACKKFHPDLGGSLEMMVLVNAAYEILDGIDEPENENFDFSGDKIKQDYPEVLNIAINQIKHLPGIIFEILGAWVWISGNTKEYKDQLKKAGFMWAPQKKQWYFRPANFKSSSRGDYTLDQIREKYAAKQYKDDTKNLLAS